MVFVGFAFRTFRAIIVIVLTITVIKILILNKMGGETPFAVFNRATKEKSKYELKPDSGYTKSFLNIHEWSYSTEENFTFVSFHTQTGSKIDLTSETFTTLELQETTESSMSSLNDGTYYTPPPLELPQTTNGDAPDKKDKPKKKLCVLPKKLGPVKINKSSISLDVVDNFYPEVEIGMYMREKCFSEFKVAIIVPLRGEDEHLAIFLRHIHPFLKKQRTEYGIFGVEQTDGKQLNKGALLNAAFKEIRAMRGGERWNCFIFHEVELLPLDSRNLYECMKQPTQLSLEIDGKKAQDVFGGVVALTLQQFTAVNGFSNRYWGCPKEHYDITNRIKRKGYSISRSIPLFARYTSLEPYEMRSSNKNNLQLPPIATEDYQRDGLNSVGYRLVGVKANHLYILIQIEITAQDNSVLMRNK